MPQMSAFLEQTVSQLSAVSDTPELDARVLLQTSWTNRAPGSRPILKRF